MPPPKGTPTMTEPTVNPRAALDASIDAARLASPLIALGDGRLRMMAPTGYQIADVTDPERLPAFIDQKIALDDADSLIAYANRFSDPRSILIADQDAGTVRAVLDWHRDNSEGRAPHRQTAAHRATLVLRDSEEFKRWNAMQGDLHDQADFAQFIEENVTDVESPDHSVLLEICRDLEASTGSAFKSGTRLDNGDRSFRYETETRITSDVTVPTEIALSIPLYLGEPPVTLRAKFRFRATPTGLKLGFRWHRVEYQRQATFRAMAFNVAEQTGLALVFGRDG